MSESSANHQGEVPSQTPSKKASSFDAKRTKLKEWITSKNVSLGGLYDGAIRILYNDPPGVGWPQFVAHAVREIRNRLPDCVAETETVSGVDYHQEVKKISKMWIKEGLPLSEIAITGTLTTSTTTLTLAIPKGIYDGILKMVKDDSEVEDRKYRSAHRLFRALVPEGDFDKKEPIIQQWIDVTEWFVERAHVRLGVRKPEDIEEYKQKFEMMEDILFGLIQSNEDFSQLSKTLNDILENTNN